MIGQLSTLAWANPCFWAGIAIGTGIGIFLSILIRWMTEARE